MPYRMVEIDVDQPLSAISLSDEESGLAVLLRWKGRPTAFWMEELPPGTVLSRGEVARQISANAGHKLLKEYIRDEIAAPRVARQTPTVSVAICTKDRPDYVKRCLRSLRSVAMPSDFPAPEIVVVDNAPSDPRTYDLIASMSDVRYVFEPRPGLNFARNRALQQASGDLLAFVDDDVVVDKYWLSGLLRAYAKNPDAVAFTGLVLAWEMATEAQVMFERHGGFRRGFDTIRYRGDFHPGNPLYPCGAGIFGAGANMAFRRDVLVELGGFDEALDTGKPLPGGGDLDIFYRVIRAGYPLVYEPCFLAFHQHRRDLPGLRRQYWSWGLGFMAFVSKCYFTDPPERSKLRRLVVWWFKNQGRQLIRSLRRGHPLTWDMVVAEIWGGVRGLFGEYARSRTRIARIVRSTQREASVSFDRTRTRKMPRKTAHR